MKNDHKTGMFLMPNLQSFQIIHNKIVDMIVYLYLNILYLCDEIKVTNII